MRNLLFGATTLALATLASPLVKQASAVEYAYCATGGWVLAGGCSYDTLEQCRAFVSGNYGHCVPNPNYRPSTTASSRSPRPRR